jgi:hypothetical protein
VTSPPQALQRSVIPKAAPTYGDLALDAPMRIMVRRRSGTVKDSMGGLAGLLVVLGSLGVGMRFRTRHL